MGWQKVGNQRYFYERKKVNGRVKSCYIGRGPEAEAKAAANAAEAARLKELDRLDREKIQRWVERDGKIKAITDQMDAMARHAFESLMASAGYHKVNGTWRKKRKARKNEVEKVLTMQAKILSERP